MKKTSSNLDKHKSIGHQFQKKNTHLIERQVLDVKCKTSAKYKNVEQKIDSGMTVNDIKYKSDRQVAKRKNENFGRVHYSTVYDIIKSDNNTEDIYSLINKDQDIQSEFDTQSVQSMQSHYSNMSLYSQTTNNNSVTQAEQKLGHINDDSYLLLDLRDQDKFETYRIQDSINLPPINLNKDKWNPEIYRFRNKENKYIIVYSSDENASVFLSNLLFEKGFDNHYLLTGGIEKFAAKYPKLIEGEVPEAIMKLYQEKKQLKKGKLVLRTNKEKQQKNTDTQKHLQLNGDEFRKSISITSETSTVRDFKKKPHQKENVSLKGFN